MAAQSNSKDNMLKSLVKNNSGVSSKSFFLVTITLIGALILLVICFIMLWETLKTSHTTIDLTGVAAVIGAVSSLFVTAGITKVWGEKNECTKCGKDKSTCDCEHQTID